MHRILVVDDSQSIVLSLSKILEINGYEVDYALNASEALHKISTKNYGVAVCDIEMPGLSGLNFLEKVRKEYDNEVEVILMTGHLDQEYFLQAIRLGAADFIRKPVESQVLVNSITRIMERRNQKHDLGRFFSSMLRTNVCFELDPNFYWESNFSKAVNGFLKHALRLKRNFINELLLCMDEMISNAMIHGTLELNSQQRLFNMEELRQLMEEHKESSNKMDRTIHVCIEMDLRSNTISISVEDGGNGFDHEAWLRKLEQQKDVNQGAHGRGISMLYYLSDKISFDNGGRKVTITRRIPRD
ncbi:MAG: response regulator [Candidatus Cloacimonetes bacterium]|nr:response regulator [Candidatus Cloacimonadota bacterium]